MDYRNFNIMRFLTYTNAKLYIYTIKKFWMCIIHRIYFLRGNFYIVESKTVLQYYAIMTKILIKQFPLRKFILTNN